MAKWISAVAYGDNTIDTNSIPSKGIGEMFGPVEFVSLGNNMVNLRLSDGSIAVLQALSRPEGLYRWHLVNDTLGVNDPKTIPSSWFTFKVQPNAQAIVGCPHGNLALSFIYGDY